MIYTHLFIYHLFHTNGLKLEKRQPFRNLFQSCSILTIHTSLWLPSICFVLLWFETIITCIKWFQSIVF